MTDDDWADYDSGPFCRHYSSPDMCERACDRCEHPCVEHHFGDGQGTGCTVDDCDCDEWVEE